DDRHEISVAAAPGHNMLVQMSGNTGSGDSSLVHTQIEAVRLAHAPHDAHGRLGDEGDLMGFVIGQLGVISYVPIRADKEVPRVVGVKVQHSVCGGTAMQHE